MGLEEIRRLKEQSGIPKPKKQYSIPKVSKKKQAALDAAKDENGDTELQKWYRGRMKYMTGECQLCFTKTERNIYQYAIFSICHILEKRKELFPSVKTDIHNWIELCPDCHHKFDSISWKEREKLGIWPIVWNRLLMIYDNIDKAELHHLPVELRERIEKESPM